MPSRRPRRLSRSFYERPTLDVARELLGKHLVFHSPDGAMTARVVEVEAYIGMDDPACHAARGLTERTRPMFGPGGFTYIYFVYGMHHCLNLVTEPEGHPAAVLIRAAEPVSGVDSLIRPERRRADPRRLLAGPGKLCHALGLTRAHNGIDLTGATIYIEDHSECPANIVQSRRIGLKVGRNRCWRFCDGDSGALSRPAADRSSKRKL